MSVLTIITVVAILHAISDIATISAFIALVYRNDIIDIKIMMAIIYVMTVKFVMAVYCICLNDCNINLYCFI